MISISASEFVKNFGRHCRLAQREPIAVTNHGHVSGYYISPQEYEDLLKAKKASRKAYSIETLPERLYQEIIHMKTRPEDEHLDLLLEEQSPSKNI